MQTAFLPIPSWGEGCDHVFLGRLPLFCCSWRQECPLTRSPAYPTQVQPISRFSGGGVSVIQKPEPQTGDSLLILPEVFSIAALSSLPESLGQIEELLFGLRDYHSSKYYSLCWSSLWSLGGRKDSQQKMSVYRTTNSQKTMQHVTEPVNNVFILGLNGKGLSGNCLTFPLWGGRKHTATPPLPFHPSRAHCPLSLKSPSLRQSSFRHQSS